MNMAERTERMKKFILMNNIVIIIQIVLVALSVIFNFFIKIQPENRHLEYSGGVLSKIALYIG